MLFETSWDDGHKLDTKIADLLEKYSLLGTFYIVCDWVSAREGYLTWEEIRKIKERGHTIGSHTMSHPQDIKRLYDEQLKYEVETSRGILESVIGESISDFCYPRGRYEQRTLNFLAEAGYVRARTTKIGITEEGWDKLEQPTTVHVFPRKEYQGEHWLYYAKRKYIEAKEKDGYFHIWGHSWEIDKLGEWENLEKFFQFIYEDRNIK